MENFIVSARKYRPATFDMVIGQDSITNTLKSAIKNKHLAQAYLFCGPRGVGKTTCARIFAKTINCVNLGDNLEACDKCESCLSFNSSRSFNIHELDAASNNKVEDIRSLNDQVRIPPQIGKYSIYIIDEVHMLSSSAFNAFLKTLEEPPSHAIFILATTEKHKIIPTILSRCQIFDFNRIRIEDIVSRLLYVAKNEGITAAEEALHVIGQKADGAMRDALSIFDQIVSLSGKAVSYKDVIDNLNVLDYEYYFKTIDGAIRGDVSTVLLTYNEILEKGFDGHNFISGLNSHMRDLLVSKDESTLSLLEATPAVKKKYMLQTADCTVDFLFKALEIGSNCDLSYKSSKNPRLHVELSLIRLCRLTDDQTDIPEKKKSDRKQIDSDPEELPLPSKSEIIRQEEKPVEKRVIADDAPVGKHEPVIDRPAKAFSIKELISDEVVSTEKVSETTELIVNEEKPLPRIELTPEAFETAWMEFNDQLKGEGTRIISMFKTIKPEFENDQTIKIHLSNAAQKDTFILNYKQRLIAFLESRFEVPSIDIETTIDLVETNDVLYTDEQKSSYLFNKYPVLKEMKKTFNLDII
ncbi:MAG: DNA polymerase III subunit gamma/tau [Bacteroidales bacterium]|nr:DNA polymerase III subunit gamma/tau [Bacteroidales bacterium]